MLSKVKKLNNIANFKNVNNLRLIKYILLFDKICLEVNIMSKKHYICTHTWNDSESRKLVIKQTKGMTDKMFFEALRSEKAETLQHWMGKEDFFYCHWYLIHFCFFSISHKLILLNFLICIQILVKL